VGCAFEELPADVGFQARPNDEDNPMTLTGQSAHNRSDGAMLRESWGRPERFADLFDAYYREIYQYVASRLSVGHADDLPLRRSWWRFAAAPASPVRTGTCGPGCTASPPT